MILKNQLLLQFLLPEMDTLEYPHELAWGPARRAGQLGRGHGLGGPMAGAGFAPKALLDRPTIPGA